MEHQKMNRASNDHAMYAAITRTVRLTAFAKATRLRLRSMAGTLRRGGQRVKKTDTTYDGGEKNREIGNWELGIKNS